ncbi:N-acetylneuraminate synthase family protein [Paraburkholderia youngii]|uniref:N-acetylneuraminate synthase n=1 Tax=Paraburkholderia youngii TaxID=2782701 RepID=A0A7W8P3V7_9BURK|nr:N-acetylneuraminate synthase family protein [Paraburkholderia youngii]MBB5402646.1 N-acetylneuraminate synthase [Paraburkholderia youngii]
MTPEFVAEFTTNHMGNLNVLLRMAEEAAAAGCDYIKMQKKDVAVFYSQDKLAAPYLSPYGKTYGDYRRVFEFGQEDFERFDRKCRSLNIPWFCTVQDAPSLEFMLGFNLPIYKVASCNARNVPFLRDVATRVPTSKRIVLSVGGSTLDEIETALSIFPVHQITVLHAVAEYPCGSESLRLGNIEKLKALFESNRVSIGYSGHEEGLAASYAAADLGACMIERHFCLSRHSFVHHIECSLEPSEFARLVRVIRSGESLKPSYRELPDAAFHSDFGMSEVERSFLTENRYGRRYLDGRNIHGQ